MSCGKGVPRRTCVLGERHLSLTALSLLLSGSVSTPWKSYHKHKSCFGGQTYHQDLELRHKLQQPLAPPTNASTRWQGKGKLKPVPDIYLYPFAEPHPALADSQVLRHKNPETLYVQPT